ncbi:unnamed protein product [Rhodiola kirilowii]
MIHQYFHPIYCVVSRGTDATRLCHHNADEASANEEAKRDFQDSGVGYSNADVVVKLQGWNTDQAKPVAQAALSALKQLILSDKKLTAKKSLYIRLGCRGDWPNIELAGLDTSADGASPPNVS